MRQVAGLNADGLNVPEAAGSIMVVPLVFLSMAEGLDAKVVVLGSQGAHA
jgi:hypothetical protein